MPLQLGPEVTGNATFKGFSEGPLVQYHVLGLPPGVRAFIARAGEHWGFLRMRDDRRPEWVGACNSPDEALAALQAAIDRNGGR